VNGSQTQGAQLQRLTLRADILDLGARYCRGVDTRDLDMFLSIWHPDGEYIVGRRRGRFRGHGELVHALEFVREAFATTHHWTTNFLIEEPRDGTIAVSSDSFAVCVTHEGKPTFVGATYDDVCERSDGVWKVRKRVVTRHFVSDPLDLHLHRIGAPAEGPLE
jgi:3-phenylpropionate/cinnamic acid dioxygenase small subunit